MYLVKQRVAASLTETGIVDFFRTLIAIVIVFFMN